MATKLWWNGPLPKLCPMSPTSNQDDRQAKNRKKGDEILIVRSHLEWKTRLSDTILKGDHPRTIPAKFPLIWFSSFRGEDSNFNCSYMAMSSLTYILGFSEIFSASLFRLGIL
jgi:hypothetical protein